MKEILSRLRQYYKAELLLCFLGLFFGFIFVFDATQYLSMIGRKIGLSSLTMLLYYVFRFTKLGVIEWRDPYDKIYSLIILVVIGIIVAFG